MNNDIKTLGFKDIPARLKEIPDPPKSLYIKGCSPFSDDNVYLCVVGARQYTEYGKQMCEKLIYGLAHQKNIVIVSGLAMGIDGIAHKAALQAGLKTISFPGSGLNNDVLYPRLNRPLAKEIVEKGGALLSEFPNDTTGAPYCFPKRNRLMAGLCHAALIIEGEIKSGSLITCRLATEYNRDVFAVPGSNLSANSAGPNYLIRQGAMLVRDSNDILEALSLPKIQEFKAGLTDCTKHEKKIIRILKGPMNRDVLIESSPLLPHETIVALSMLEIKGLIKEVGGEIFFCGGEI